MRQQSRTALNQRSTSGRARVASSFLADQQNKQSDSYQQGKQNTDDERNNRMPTRLDLFRSRAFLRRSDTQPEEKFVHRQDLATREPLHMGSVSVLGKPNDDPHKTIPIPHCLRAASSTLCQCNRTGLLVADRVCPGHFLSKFHLAPSDKVRGESVLFINRSHQRREANSRKASPVRSTRVSISNFGSQSETGLRSRRH